MPEPQMSQGAPGDPNSRSSPRERACSPKDGRFQAALDCIAEAHSQEVCNLNEENQHLRTEVMELRDHLRQVQARAICAKIDEPKMHSLAQSVAADVAGWVDDGGIQWEEGGEQDLPPPPPQPLRTSPRLETLPEESAAERETPREERGSAQQKNTKKSTIRDRSSRGSQESSVAKAIAFMEPDIQVLNSSASGELHPAPRASGSTLGTGSHNLNNACRSTGCRSTRNRKSMSQMLRSPEGEEARLIAQETLATKRKRSTPLQRALAMRNTLSNGVFGRNMAMASKRNCIEKIVHNTAFDLLCALMILINSILIGWTTQHLSIYTEESLPMTIIGYLCSLFFLGELIVRMIADGASFFTAHDSRVWNAFDTGLVVFSIVEFVMSINGHSGGVGGSIKTIKMLRILRLFRVFRFFKDLSLLALMVIDSMKSLCNALAMLLIITYVFAICFTVQSSNWLHVTANRSIAGADKVEEHFGNLWKTLYALLQAMLQGISWGELTNALLLVDGFSFALFIFYVFFTMLAVLNIITGVFVDNAVETARSQRDYLVQKEIELKEMYVKEMQKLFSQMDEDNSGTVSLDEVKEYFEDPNVRSYFTALGLDPADSERLFELLDDDGSGEVGVTEFIDGCLRLKGQARSIDVYALQLQSDRLENKLKDVADVLPKSYRKSQVQEAGQVMIFEEKI